MKTGANGSGQSTRPQTKAVKKPENKDNLDSREGEEQLTKKNDITHNKTEQHSKLKSQHKQ